MGKGGGIWTVHPGVSSLGQQTQVEAGPGGGSPPGRSLGHELGVGGPPSTPSGCAEAPPSREDNFQVKEGAEQEHGEH